MIRRILYCILMLSFIGCATTIGNKADLREVKFVIGQTKKTEVAETLGLPAGIIKKKEEKREYWYYYDGPVLSGLVLPVPDIGGVSAVPFSVITNPELKDAAVIFVFDNTDILFDIIKKGDLI